MDNHILSITEKVSKIVNFIQRFQHVYHESILNDLIEAFTCFMVYCFRVNMLTKQLTIWKITILCT